MVADGDERDAGRAEADETEKSVGIVDGGGVEQQGHHLGYRPDRRDHSLPRDAAQVGSPSRPLHLPLHRPHHHLLGQLQRRPSFLIHGRFGYREIPDFESGACLTLLSFFLR